MIWEIILTLSFFVVGLIAYRAFVFCDEPKLALGMGILAIICGAVYGVSLLFG